MSKTRLSLAVFAAMAGCTFAASEITSPTAARILEAAGNPVRLPSLLTDATPTQAADVLARTVGQVGTQGISTDRRKQTIGLLTGYTYAAMSGQTAELSRALFRALAPEVLPTVIASAAATSGDQAQAALDAFAAVASGTPQAGAVDQAVANPAEVLGGALWEQLSTVDYSANTGAEALGGKTVPRPPPVAMCYRGQWWRWWRWWRNRR